MTDVREAEVLVLANVPRTRAVAMRLDVCAGAVLAQEICAERDQPPFDRVTMDGIAFASHQVEAGVRDFQVTGIQAAGAPPLTLGAGPECIAVMTGAVLPGGADTVVPVERIERHDEVATLRADAAVAHGQFIHRRGSDHLAGQPLLRPGTRIGPAEMAALASSGLASVQVAASPSVAVVSTGDELVDVGEPLAPWQIRSTNDRAIEASLLRHRLGVVTRAHVADDEAALRTSLSQLLAAHDVLILSGGVSMGKFDYVPGILGELGVRQIFHKVEQRPGRPMWFGVADDGKPVFALPGNPVSALVCLTRFVLPALAKSLGLREPRAEFVRLAGRVETPADLAYFTPVIVESLPEGAVLARPRHINTSGDFVSLAGTDGIVELPRGRAFFEEGEGVQLFRW